MPSLLLAGMPIECYEDLTDGKDCFEMQKYRMNGENDSTSYIPLSLKQVWDFQKIKKSIDAEDGKEKWICLHCHGTWTKQKQSKFIQHLLSDPDKQQGKVQIEENWKIWYNSLCNQQETWDVNKNITTWNQSGKNA